MGFEWAGMTCKGQVENDAYCNKILQKNFPHVQKFGDVKSLNCNDIPTTDVIAGGPPCQPSSNAGKRKGPEDSRWLWKETLEIVSAKLPAWVVLENPTGFNSVALGQVLSVLEGKDYEVWCGIIPSCGIGASHQRNRTWIIANRNGKRLPLRDGKGHPETQTGRINERRSFERVCTASLWGEREIEPGMVRTLDGVSNRVDRIRAIGNSIDPRIAFRIGFAIMAAENKKAPCSNTGRNQKTT